MASNLQDVKTYVKTQLDALVTAQTIKYAGVFDLRKNPFEYDIPDFPAAYLMPPATESDVYDNRTIIRTYTFDVLFLMKPENFTTAYQFEDLLEAILNKFDNLPSMSGEADAGSAPATSAPFPVQTKGGDLIGFNVTLKVNRTESLTY